MNLKQFLFFFFKFEEEKTMRHLKSIHLPAPSCIKTRIAVCANTVCCYTLKVDCLSFHIQIGFSPLSSIFNEIDHENNINCIVLCFATTR